MPKNVNYDTSERMIISREIVTKVIYRTKYGTYFEVDGDLTRVLEVKGGTSYVRDWIRERLRKMENGQIKVVKGSSERDWEQEEEMRKRMWEDVNVNSTPQGWCYNEIICTQKLEYHIAYEKRPPSPPCRIS